ncbi:hypothetical protein AOL_s00193g114 [Orbilia oligospora ATCC 24927]|uniref:Cryptic loci regulator 2 N-terminal domain-containing protein n=1 Tax=Arthrobotrys oligospora (strain ATCC 24927 / CBS 115.81 / DSM 1491) TaxID=756982 RepID=G1XRB5_ARTOA|nr:hypothetical protein AOL_s00193g114 [Orbilia oligospora ATCC 24927]EGX44386.1 hypothetical protein AOL_s00193g114 [Orbilia oligospora ATCC 24927]
MEPPPIFSADATVAFLSGKTRRVLTLQLPSLETSSDSFPTNIRDPQKSLKPGEKVDWYLRDDLAAVNIYRAKLGDLVAEEFGFHGTEDWMLRDLPTGYAIFTSQKGTVDDKGKLVIERQDSYLYGHQSGARYRSPKEFLPHVASIIRQNEDSLSGLPRNTTITHDPLYACSCQHCTKKTRRPSQTTMSRQAELISKSRSIAIMANYQHALSERRQDLNDGAWRFRQGELVWVFEAPRKPTGSGDLEEPLRLSDPSDPDGTFGAGGRWIAGYIVGSSTAVVMGSTKPMTIDDYADAYMVDEPEGTHYRIQKCGSDNYVKDYNLRYVLPWAKTPVKDDARGIVIDHVSRGAAMRPSMAVFQVARKNVAPSFDGAKIIYELEGVFFGPEKIWVGDAIRIQKKNPPPPDMSVWDPASHGLMVIRKLGLAVGHTEGQPDNTLRYITLYFVGDLLSTDPPRPLDPIPFEIPFYLEKAGTDYGKWVGSADSESKSMEGIVSAPVVLSRYYDPRIMQLIDTNYQTIDSVIRVDGIMNDRALSCGFTLLNGESLRPPTTIAPLARNNHMGTPAMETPGPEDEHQSRDSGERQKRPKLH